MLVRLLPSLLLLLLPAMVYVTERLLLLVQEELLLILILGTLFLFKQELLLTDCALVLISVPLQMRTDVLLLLRLLLLSLLLW